jgi:hypothetical protein
MRLALGFAACALAALALPAAARDKRPVSARRVEQEIATGGAKKALARLYDDEAAWASVTSRIADGGRDWLAIAERFLGVASDPAAYDLEAAVGEALEEAPQHVLAIADEKSEIAISWVCAETATVAEDPSDEERIDLLAAREKAVTSVKDPALAKKRDACLKALAQARQAVERELRDSTRKIS